MLSNNDFKNFISCYHSIIGLENKNILSCIPDSKKYEFTNRVKEILDKRIENALGFIPDYMKNQPHDYAINQKDDKTYLSFDFGNLIIDYMYHNLLSSNVTKAHVSSALKPAILKMCGAYCHHRDEEFKDSINLFPNSSAFV